MELVIPWALVAILYTLGGIVIYEDMKEADRHEPWIDPRYQGVSYFVCVGLWPGMVLVFAIFHIIAKLKERRS